MKKLSLIAGIMALAVLLVLPIGCKQKSDPPGGQPPESAANDTMTGMPKDTMGGGAKSYGDPPAKGSVTFTKDIQPIFSKKCSNASCHGAAKSAGMQLSGGMAYENTVNVASSEAPRYLRIKPGAPDSSWLVMKLEGRQTFGAKMPLVGGPLSDKQIQAIRGWIAAGAKKD